MFDSAHTFQVVADPGFIIVQDGYISVLDGMWLGYQLSVTRALGHRFMEKHGVLSEPHVQCFRAREDDRCMVSESLCYAM